MCGPIYNTYRGCGHKLDSGEVEPCEDGIIENKVCKGPDGKPPGEVFDQIIHSQCPACEQAQQELDEDLDSPRSSYVSDKPSRISKVRQKQPQAQAPPLDEASTRSSRRTASTRKPHRIVPEISEPATSDRCSRATTRLTARQAGKQPMYKSQQQASSVASSSRAGEAISTASKKLSRSTSKAGPARQSQHAASAAASSQQSVSDVDDDGTVSDARPRAVQADRAVPQSMISTRSSSTKIAASRAPIPESVATSGYASTVRRERNPAGASRMSSRRSASTVHGRNPASPSHMSSRRSASTRHSSRASTRHGRADRPRDLNDEATTALTDAVSTVPRGLDTQHLQPPQNVAPGRLARNEADQHLQDARSNLQERLDYAESKTTKRSLLSRASGLLKGKSVHNAGDTSQDRDLSMIDERTEATSVPRHIPAQSPQPEYFPPQDQNYVQPDNQPAPYDSSRGRLRRRGQDVAGETYEQMSARRLAEEMVKAQELERHVTVAREELREAEDRAFESDTRLAIEQSQVLSPHEQWQETNIMRQAMHASLRHQRDFLQQSRDFGGQTTQLVFEQCGHRITKDAAAYTDPGRPTPRFVHQKGLCDTCQARAQPQSMTSASSLPQRPNGGLSRAQPDTTIPDIVIEPSSAVQSRRRQRYEPTESPTMTSSERAEVRRPPPSFASSGKRRNEVAVRRAASVAPSMGVPVDVAMRSQGSEEASRRRLFDRKNREFAEYQRRHPNGTDTGDEGD